MRVSSNYSAVRPMLYNVLSKPFDVEEDLAGAVDHMGLPRLAETTHGKANLKAGLQKVQKRQIVLATNQPEEALSPVLATSKPGKPTGGFYGYMLDKFKARTTPYNVQQAINILRHYQQQAEPAVSSLRFSSKAIQPVNPELFFKSLKKQTRENIERIYNNVTAKVQILQRQVIDKSLGSDRDFLPNLKRISRYRAEQMLAKNELKRRFSQQYLTNKMAQDTERELANENHEYLADIHMFAPHNV